MSGTKFSLPQGYEDQIVLNWKQLLTFLVVFGIFVSYGISYCADLFLGKDLGIHTFFNLLIYFIASDWQLAFSFIIIILLTLGWHLLQIVSVGIIHLNAMIGVKIGRKKGTIIRYILGIYLVSLLISYNLFGYGFDDLMLWISSVFVCAFLSIIIYGIIKFIDDIRKPKTTTINRQVLPVRSEEPDEISSKYILIICGVLAFLLSIVLLWDFYSALWGLMHSNLVISTYFWFTMSVTVFWKPLCFLGALLTVVPHYIVKTYVRRKINRFRIVLSVFALSLLCQKLIPVYSGVLGMNEFQASLVSMIASAIAGVMSWYLTRKFFVRV